MAANAVRQERNLRSTKIDTSRVVRPYSGLCLLDGAPLTDSVKREGARRSGLLAGGEDRAPDGPELKVRSVVSVFLRWPLWIAADEAEQLGLGIGIVLDRHSGSILAGRSNDLLQRLHA
jgi:hypothetical protein